MSGKVVGMMLFFLVLLKLFFKNVSLFRLAFIQNLVISKRLTMINFIFPLGAFPKYLLVIYSIKIMKKLSQLFAIFCLSISINSKAQNLPNSQTLKLPSAAPLEGNNKNFFEIQKRNIDNLILEASKKK